MCALIIHNQHAHALTHTHTHSGCPLLLHMLVGYVITHTQRKSKGGEREGRGDMRIPLHFLCSSSTVPGFSSGLSLATSPAASPPAAPLPLNPPATPPSAVPLSGAGSGRPKLAATLLLRAAVDSMPDDAASTLPIMLCLLCVTVVVSCQECSFNTPTFFIIFFCCICVWPTKLKNWHARCIWGYLCVRHTTKKKDCF